MDRYDGESPFINISSDSTVRLWKNIEGKGFSHVEIRSDNYRGYLKIENK